MIISAQVQSGDPVTTWSRAVMMSTRRHRVRRQIGRGASAWAGVADAAAGRRPPSQPRSSSTRSNISPVGAVQAEAMPSDTSTA
jgi:hypothetical protein